MSCADCGVQLLLRVYRCRDCGTRNIADKDMPGTGRSLTHTKLHEPLPGFEAQVPHNLAVIELQNGARVLAQIVDTPQEKIETGAKARAVIRRVQVDGDSGQILYGYKFVVG